jgi:cell division protein FtsI/penicillin-binding protein 2
VRIVGAGGQVVKEIERVDGSPPTPVRTTVDPDIQAKAEAALASGVRGKSGALVVIDRNGGIKAMANTGSGFNWATAQYPPGSTFKVITAAALLNSGLGPDTQLTCPPTINAGGQPFANFEGEQEASLTFTRAFAISCNTAFIGAAQKLSGEQMHQMASQFGFNVDYDIGIPMKVRGSMPDDGAAAAKSSQAIGQGSVLTNPVHMAAVAATAMTGTWKAPSFLADRPPTLPSGQPLDPRVLADLQTFMRANVESGSGTAAAAPGKVVYGKTGTAEFGSGPKLPTHAWYIGFAGDLAMAVVVNSGGVGGEVAAPIAGKFFQSL